MVFPREVLNELRWHPDKSLDRAEITFEHRGASEDVKIISGKDIVSLGKSFFSTGESDIPYHRIKRIRLLSDRGDEERSWEFG